MKMAIILLLLHSIPFCAALFKEPSDDVDLTSRDGNHDSGLDDAIVEDFAPVERGKVSKTIHTLNSYFNTH
jgi:hypothetical protein